MAVKISVGGGQQIVPNAKEVLAKIKSTAYCSSNPPPYPVTSVNGKTGAVTIAEPTKRYMHYFIHSSLADHVIFSVLSTDSPSYAASNVGTVIDKSLSGGISVPATGFMRGKSDGDYKNLPVWRASLTNKYLYIFALVDNSSGMKEFSKLFAESNFTWDHSVEV